MAKDRINRDELANKLVERAAEAEDPLRAMAELITGFLMEAEVANQVGAEVHERTEQRTTHRNGYRDRRLGHAAGDHAVAGAEGTRGWLCAKFYRTPQAQRAGADQRDPGSGGKGCFDAQDRSGSGGTRHRGRIGGGKGASMRGTGREGAQVPRGSAGRDPLRVGRRAV